MNPLEYRPNAPGSIRPQPRPPTDQRPALQIVRAPAAGCHVYTLLSNDVHGYFLHFVGKRTIPCPNDLPLTCALCHNGIGSRWTGFLAGIDHTGRVHLVQVTEGAVENCKPFDQWAGDLRGRRISLARMKGHKTGPVKVTIERVKTAAPLPSEPDVHAALCRIWGIRAQPQPAEKGGL